MKNDSKQASSSQLLFTAGAQAAAQGAAPALSPGRRITAVAALAGFVLRLFRRTASESTAVAPRGQRGGRAMPKRCSSVARAKRERTRSETRAKRGLRAPVRSLRVTGSRGAATMKGGLRHG